MTTLQNMVPITVALAYNAAAQRSRYTVVMSGTPTLDEHFQYRSGELDHLA